MYNMSGPFQKLGMQQGRADTPILEVSSSNKCPEDRDRGTSGRQGCFTEAALLPFLERGCLTSQAVSIWHPVLQVQGLQSSKMGISLLFEG